MPILMPHSGYIMIPSFKLVFFCDRKSQHFHRFSKAKVCEIQSCWKWISHLKQIIWNSLKNFLHFWVLCSMNCCKPLIIYQDNALVISLIMEGGGTTRMKHLRPSMHWAITANIENKIFILYKVQPWWLQMQDFKNIILVTIFINNLHNCWVLEFIWIISNSFG